ncbi:MAG: BMP family ABC transporter substrate-binding protein, partial [Bacteroidia bacterium]
SEPFIREVPTNGTAVDRLSRIRFLAKSGYTLIVAVGAGYRETVRRVSIENPEIQFAIINDKVLGQMNISNIYFKESDGAYLVGPPPPPSHKPCKTIQPSPPITS